MTTTRTIASAMTGQDASNGWDAAYGMSLAQVNALFLQQYLQNGPTNPAMPLRVVMQVQQTFWILDVVLGPPKLAFHPDHETATLEMELVRGSLITFDPRSSKIGSAAQIRPNESKLTGPVELARTKGEVNQLGKVVADLGASAYTPSIAGVDPKSVLTNEIGQAVRTFFAANQTTYPLGAIAPNKDLPASLQPTDFHFYTQRKAGTNDAAVLLLIRTTGPAGTVGPLAAYPIPEGKSAALIVAGRVVSGLLIDYLNGVFSSLGSRFNMQANGASWRVTSSGGTLDFGQIGRRSIDDGSIFSSDANKNEQPVRMPCDGFTVEPSQGMLVASWDRDWQQYWTKFEGMNGKLGPVYSWHDSHIRVSFRQNGQPSVDPVTDEVTFNGKPSFSVTTPDAPSWFEQIFLNEIKFPDVVRNGIQSRIAPIISTVRLPSVNAFALTNLLFPSRHAVSLREAAIPADLYLTGTLVQPIEVTPAEAIVVPGKTVQFQAPGHNAADLLWTLKPRLGTIDGNGLYTAPTSVREATVVVVSAVSRQDASTSGSAMVLVYEPVAQGGVAVAPGAAVVAPGQTIDFSTANDKGESVAVTWTLSPDLGRMTKGFLQGQYSYTAPATIDAATEIRATATNSAQADKHGVASIRLVPVVDVTVTPAEASVKPGGTLELTATAPHVDPAQFRWAIFPTGAGSVTAHDDPSRATYRAPATLPPEHEVRVVAYAIDDAAGIGSADVTLTPRVSARGEG
jgi:hypothetical protein